MHLEYIQEAAAYVKAKLGEAKIAVVLGTGLGAYASALENAKSLDYRDIPHMPGTTVHAGQLTLGTVNERKVYAFRGRCHPYEGFHPYQATFAAHLMAALGCRVCLLSNAAGGCLPGMTVPCVMAITDHINAQGRNPLDDTWKDPRFGTQASADNLYSTTIRKIAKPLMPKHGIGYFEGVYAFCMGPVFDTPQDVQAGLGAFGMSTVPEVLAARSAGLEVFALSVITNMGCGLEEGPLDDRIVRERGNDLAPRLRLVFNDLIGEIDPFQFPDPRFGGDSTRWSQVIPSVMDCGCASYEDIQRAAEQVRKVLGTANTLVAPAMYHQDPWTDSPSIPLNTLPGFPNVSSGIGMLTKDKDALVVYGLEFGGLGWQDADYIMGVALCLGAGRVIASTKATSLDPTPPGVVVCQSVLTFADAVRTPPPGDERLYCKGEPILVVETSHSFASFPPPFSPTPAEKHIAKEAGVDVVGGVDGIALIEAARTRGCVFALVCEVGDASVTETIKALAATPSSLCVPSQGVCWRAPTSGCRWVEKTGLWHDQPDTEQVQAIAQQVRQLSKAKIHQSIHAIYVDPALSLCMEELGALLGGWDGSALAQDIKEWGQAHGRGGSVAWGHIKDHSVLAFVGAGYARLGSRPADVALCVNIAKEVGAERILLLSTGFPAAKDAPAVGSVVQVKDHVHMIQQCPGALFGRERFGRDLRFPDMSHPYEGEDGQVVMAAASDALSPWCASDVALKKLSSAYGAQVLSPGLVSEVIVARHCGLRIKALCQVIDPTSVAAHEMGRVVHGGKGYVQHCTKLVKEAWVLENKAW